MQQVLDEVVAISLVIKQTFSISSTLLSWTDGKVGTQFSFNMLWVCAAFTAICVHLNSSLNHDAITSLSTCCIDPISAFLTYCRYLTANIYVFFANGARLWVTRIQPSSDMKEKNNKVRMRNN